jgi:hypothetical protein
MKSWLFDARSEGMHAIIDDELQVVRGNDWLILRQ